MDGTGRPVPRHLGLIIDGNRRWARERGLAPSVGHRRGAEHLETVLGWCAELGIEQVTFFLCSTENLLRRSPAEVGALMDVIGEVVAGRLGPGAGWRVHLAGSLEAVPEDTARALREAVAATRTVPGDRQVTLAIGYGGRQELVHALRTSLLQAAAAGRSLREVAGTLTMDDVAGNLYTAGQAEPDVIVRTSGEKRMSNFLLWQSTRARLHFCDAYWPAFSRTDLLDALRTRRDAPGIRQQKG